MLKTIVGYKIMWKNIYVTLLKIYIWICRKKKIVLGSGAARMNTVDDLYLDETDRAVALRQNNKQIKKKKKRSCFS